MNVMIDIGHPAHVHYYKNIVRVLQRKGHKVLFITRDKDVTISLLKHYGFDYRSLGKGFRSRTGKIWGLFWFTFKIFLISRKFKPDMFLNASLYTGFLAYLFRKPQIALEDTFNMEQVKLYLPFTSCIITGDYPHPDLGHSEIRVKAYQEMLYLHPDYYTPGNEVWKELKLHPGDKYVILRFVSWSASHDFGHRGITNEIKMKLIRELSAYATVFISSESPLPEEFQPYRISIPPYMMHDALYHAQLLFCESFTMASESCILGTPSVVVHDTRSFYLQDQSDKYGLVHLFTESEEDQEKAVSKAVEILKENTPKSFFRERSKALLNDCIDFSGFLFWLVENWPDSFLKVKADPGFQDRFKS